MLISKVPDNEGGKGEGHEVRAEEDHDHEYQTANELFELMAKNQRFNNTDVDTLTTRDLVLLYKNIDLGTKLMSNANEIKLKRPNQHVETVVYNDDQSEGSDLSEIYSNEDLQNMFLVNKERIDLLNAPSVENTLCHKYGDIEIHTTEFATEYDKHFLFKDPYIKEQLKSLKLMTSTTEVEGAILPASLLDYICCKRLEDNYNFYMDNIIRYVKHTIDQLKRISNGDYLTDKAKEKWREVDTATEDPRLTNTKVLSTSTSIPLHVERKIGGCRTTWDDIVHSAVDIRSLSKILEKKIVVEVPKLICGPYKLLSKCCADNLFISCTKKRQFVDKSDNKSRVDVVFKLQRSDTGHVISNISSIMILQDTRAIQPDTRRDVLIPLSLSYKEQINENNALEENVKVTELDQVNVTNETLKESECDGENKSFDSDCSEFRTEDPYLDSIDYDGSDHDGNESLKNASELTSIESSDALKELLDKKFMYAQRELSPNVVYPDDLRLTIKKLTMQAALTEESGEDMSQTTAVKKKSSTRIRIKSPYENQSFIMEEKKRKKLLEIRDRRERKKMALAENCRITKHKYGKGTITPQSASSVTKLSISNKSFYNSIYGQTSNADDKYVKGKNRKGGKRDLEAPFGDDEGEQEVATVPEQNKKKYTNRSYYLDDAVTEMMYTNMKRLENEGKDLCSTSTSVISNDFHNNLHLLSQLISPSDTALNNADDEVSGDDKQQSLSVTKANDIIDENAAEVPTSPSLHNMVPSNSPTKMETEKKYPKKQTSTFECRQSIDKIYNLMRNLGKAHDSDSKSSKSKYTANNTEKSDFKSSTCQGSDSGTSLKHQPTSSNASCFSFDKNNADFSKSNNNYNQKTESPVVPKVIISSKSHSQTFSPKPETEKNKKDRKKTVNNPIIKIPENPLKAISQLLREFENVQKNRKKPISEQKLSKKSEFSSSEGKSGSRQGSSKRRSRIDKHHEEKSERNGKILTPKEKKKIPMDIPKIPYQQIPVDEKHSDKMPKKKMTDMLDEAKEARGEAVRGPSKLNSRLNSLAQPKRSYVQAHSEEYQTKYGKNVMADRLQRLAAAPPPPLADRNMASASSKYKAKRNGTEAVSAVSVKLPSPTVPPLERGRARHSTNSSPDRKDRLNHGLGSSFKQTIVPETPETLIKKMVAVESYVKSHYGRSTSTAADNELLSAQKSRVPLLPKDIELVSLSSSPQAEESTELGSRLHYIINTMIKSSSQALEVLPECQESGKSDFKMSKEKNYNCSLQQYTSKTEHISSGSDYTLDILNDSRVLTTIESVEEISKQEQTKSDFGKGESEYSIQSFKSVTELEKLDVTELEKLENALYRRISLGAFPKRLRIKNLTLTPKQSMQPVFVLQSGDVGSVVVETKPESLTELKSLPVISKSHLDWSFTKFPMQISTVGYVIPEYQSIQCDSSSLVKLFGEVSKKQSKEQFLPKDNLKSDVENQCVIGGQPQPLVERAAQVELPIPTLVSIGISSTHIIDAVKEEEKVKQYESIGTETKHTFIDYSENKIVEESQNTNQSAALEKNKDINDTASKGDDIEFTTSLDILVGLLNEIQKITTCQTQMTNANNDQNSASEAKQTSEEQQSKELETILDQAAAIESSIKSCPCDVVSFSSLDRLRQLESNPSLYSFFMSDNEGSEILGNNFMSPRSNFPSPRNNFPSPRNNFPSPRNNFPSTMISISTTELFSPKLNYADKEVSVDLMEKECVNRCTDVPSQIFPVACMNHSTNVTNSLIEVISAPSTQSMYSFTEYHSVYSNTATVTHNSMADVPQIVITRESNHSVAICEISQPIVKTAENIFFKDKVQSFDEDRIKTKVNITKGKYCLKSEFDPVMKMKRDILVTFYSILVFTVFAALSFPSELLYHNI